MCLTCFITAIPWSLAKYQNMHTEDILFDPFIQTLCHPLHLIGSLQNALQYLQLEEAIESYSNLKPKFQLHGSQLDPWFIHPWHSMAPLDLEDHKAARRRRWRELLHCSGWFSKTWPWEKTNWASKTMGTYRKNNVIWKNMGVVVECFWW